MWKWGEGWEREDTGRIPSLPLSEGYSLIPNSGFLSRGLQIIGGLGETAPVLSPVSESAHNPCLLTEWGRQAHPVLCASVGSVFMA